MTTALWDHVDALIDRAPDLDDLRAHRVHLLAARRWRSLGRVIPPELVQEELEATFVTLAAPAVLREARSACEGPIVIMKGPELAARYPEPALRPYVDLDLVVPDAQRAERALVAAGFRPVGDPWLYREIHHLRPLHSPSFPLYIEVHSRPKWLPGRTPPSFDELVEAAQPTVLGVDGVLAPAPAHHALLLAAHSWAHEPLRRLGDLIDVAAVSNGLDPDELCALSVRWGLRRVWRTTTAAMESCFFGGRKSWPLRTWARHLPDARRRSVLESHLEHWLSGFSALPARDALVVTRRAVARELTPAPGETLGKKLSRTRLAVRNALVARSDHTEELHRTGRRAPHFYELEDDDPSHRAGPLRRGGSR